jgi:hypothetical protein
MILTVSLSVWKTDVLNQTKNVGSDARPRHLNVSQTVHKTDVFSRYSYTDDTLELSHVISNDQIVDCLTKSFEVKERHILPPFLILR